MFDITKYKNNILEAARVAGVSDIAIARGSLKGDFEPTLYISCWSKKDREATEDKFTDSLCNSIEEDIDWLILAQPPAIVKENSGVLLVREGVWCYE